MTITLKLFAQLHEFLPLDFEGESRRGNELTIRIDDGETVQQVIERFKLPAKLVHLVLVNGKYYYPNERTERVLIDGEALAIWPPVAGG